jgi:flagellar hook-length control protein FliK
MNADFLIIDNVLSLNSMRDVNSSTSSDASDKIEFSLPAVDESEQDLNSRDENLKGDFDNETSERPAKTVVSRRDSQSIQNSSELKEQSLSPTEESKVQGGKKTHCSSIPSIEENANKTLKSKTEESISPVIIDISPEQIVAATIKAQDANGDNSAVIATAQLPVLTNTGNPKQVIAEVIGQQKNIIDKESLNPESATDSPKLIANRNQIDIQNTKEIIASQISENRSALEQLKAASLTERRDAIQNIQSQRLTNSAQTDNSPTNVLNELLNRPSATNLNTTQIPAALSQSKNHISESAGKDINSNLHQDSGSSQLHTGLLEQTLNASKSVGLSSFPRQTPSSDTASDIGRQILDSIQNSLPGQGNNNQITVRLNPPELGQVVIKFQEKGSQLTGLLEFSNNQTRTEVEQALPQIIRSLADSGVDIKRLEVVLSNNSQSGNQSQDQSFLNAEHQQQNSANQNNYSYVTTNDSEQNGWFNLNINYPETGTLINAATADNSINILL